MKETYREMVNKHWKQAQDATRTPRYKAAAAYLYGDAATIQQDCAFGLIPSENDDIQSIAMALEAVALKVLNAERMEVSSCHPELECAVEALLEVLP